MRRPEIKSSHRTDFQAIADRLLSALPEEHLDDTEEFDLAVWRDNASAAGVPRRALNTLSTDIIQTEAMQEIELFPPNGILVLSGRAGCGKTVAASKWLCDKVTDKPNVPPVVRFATVPDIERMGRYNAKALGALESIPFLAIDEIGSEFLDTRGSFTSVLDAILGKRDSECRETLLTTNLTAEQFKSSYGMKIIDRIRGAGRFASVDAPSLRGKKSG